MKKSVKQRLLERLAGCENITRQQSVVRLKFCTVESAVEFHGWLTDRLAAQGRKGASHNGQ